MALGSIITRICVAALWLAATTGAAFAQTERPLTQAERNTFAAIGRVNQGLLIADSTCTGTLISPTRVLTASHCVKADDTPMTFLAGFHAGRTLARLRAMDRSRHPRAVLTEVSRATIPFDLAMLHVSAPETLSPIPLGPPPVVGEALTLVSYRNAARDSATLTTPCDVLTLSNNTATLACEAHSGMSGAPVLRLTQSGPEIAAILVARGTGISFAAVPNGWPD